MSTRLQDDLFQDFQEQRKFIHDQVQMFAPVAESLSRPAAARIFSKMTLVVCEFLCYVLCLGSVALIFLMDKLVPFSTISTILYNAQVRMAVGEQNAFLLKITMIGLFILIAILFYLLGAFSRNMRLKNSILHIASKDVKILTGQLLRRKAAIEAIEQRHFEELPFPAAINVNTVANPAYDPNEPQFIPPAHP
ncbi:MAG: hypothetical protein ACXVAU_19540 [Mucilaginibacter sp.]